MSDDTFEIGLVGAGAVSAGAYTGGVIDFIVQALDQWYEAKSNGDQAPPHDVKLSVFSGASAGAMTAALATAYLASDQPPVTDEAAGLLNNGRNRLFDAWVDRVDMTKLLGKRDLADEEVPVSSLLDSSILTEIADAALNVTPLPERRPYLAENFELVLTVTNLRGVPYAFKVLGDQEASYDMSLHADYIHFRITDSDQGPLPDRYTMTWSDFGVPTPIKEKLKLAALASGAFPIGLAPVNLSHVIPGHGQTDWYSARKWPVPTPFSTNPHECLTPESIPANWGELQADYPYNFQCVDGGAIDNEPLELARRLLAGPRSSNPRDGRHADKALVLIDPFPNQAAFATQYAPAADLLGPVAALINALLNQARFKPDELILAADPDVYSRFMIAPRRGDAIHPIACGALNGFGGFLKRDFRSHDYFLGRRNAQKFLRDHFVLPERNPLFRGWNEAMKKAYCVRDRLGQPKKEKGQRFLPIIPLVGQASAPCYKPQWPHYTEQDLAQLAKPIEGRAAVVLDRLVRQYFGKHNVIVRFVARIIVGLKKRDAATAVQNRIRADLKKMGLMSDS